MSQKLWGDKPYYSLNHYLKNTFGEKIYKVSLNPGFTCPNRDGTLDTRGCIFCSAGGSGDFSASSLKTITDQINSAKNQLTNKFSGSKYIAYFQAYTNTYSDLQTLKRVYTEAILHEDIVALSIATRPDCLNDDVIALLSELNAIKPVWVELGLQTIHEESAKYIRRGYELKCFEQAVADLSKHKIDTIVHLILGLPNESTDDILQSIDYIAKLPIQGIKLQLLHVLKGTDLATDYLNHTFDVLTQDAYIDLLINCIERLPQKIVIHRLTGDGPKDLLIAPLWSTNKRNVLNSIHKVLKHRQSYQGKFYSTI